MHNYKKDRIAYSNWARLNHPDPEKRKYWDDQCRQREVYNELRSKSAEVVSRQSAKAARETIALKYGEADAAQEYKWKFLSFVLKPDGSVAPPGWLAPAIMQAECDRTHYWRPDSRGGWRRDPIIRTVKAAGFKGDAGEKRQTGTTRSEYDFEIATAKARGFFLACEAGLESLSRQLLEEIGQYTIEVVHEETGGMLMLSCPMHAKPEALHPQPTWSSWSDPVPRPDGKPGPLACLKAGGVGFSSNRIFSYLGKPLIGARAQVRMGLNVDALTGRKDAAQGIERILKRKSTVKAPLDVRVRDRIEAFIKKRLKAKKYARLRPHMAESERIYRARKVEQLDLLASWDTRKLVDDAKAETAKERTAREAADNRIVQLEERLKQVQEENRALLATSGGAEKEAPMAPTPATAAPVPAAPAPRAAPAKETAAPAAAATEKKPTGPLFTAEESLAALQAANDLVKTGADLSTLTDRQREIVEIKPATRVKRTQGEGGKLIAVKEGDKEVMEAHPFAGKVGLTPKAHQSIMAVINTTTTRLAKRDTISVAEADTLKGKLDSYTEVITAAKASMGIEASAPDKILEHAQT